MKLTNFCKSLRTGSYLSVIAAILGLVAMILSIVSSNNVGYAIGSLGGIIAMSIIAIVLVAVSLYLTTKLENKTLSYLPLLVAGILFGICFILMLSERAYLIGTLWFTKLDAANEYANAAMNTGSTSFILYLISMLLIAAGSFFNLKKLEKSITVQSQVK